MADPTVRKPFAQSQALPAHVSLSVRQAQAASLRLQGRTYADIGRRLGISRERARQLVSKFRSVVDAYQDGQVKQGSRRARPAERTRACELPAGKPVCLEYARFAGVNSVQRSTRHCWKAGRFGEYRESAVYESRPGTPKIAHLAARLASARSSQPTASWLPGRAAFLDRLGWLVTSTSPNAPA